MRHASVYLLVWCILCVCYIPDQVICPLNGLRKFSEPENDYEWAMESIWAPQIVF